MSPPRSAAILGLALLASGFALACAGDEETTPTPTPTATSTQSATTTSTPGPTVTPTDTPPIPTASATPDAEVEPRKVTGLDAPLGDPPAVDALPFPEMPASSFSPWDGQSVMLYDVVAMTERNLGPGAFVGFSPDGSKLAWVAGEAGREQQAFVLQLPDGQPRSLGPARTIRWLNNDEVRVHLPDRLGQSGREIVVVATGERRADNAAPEADAPGSPVSVGDLRLEREVLDDYPHWRSAFRVSDPTGTLAPLEFEATRAILIQADSLFVMAIPDMPSGAAESVGPDVEWAESNLFQVDIESGGAVLIATTTLNAPNTPFAASSRHLAWGDNGCGLPDAGPSRTVVYDRETEEFTAFDRGAWVTLTERGELGIGEFGPRALLDLETLEYTVVIDPNGVDIVWSQDYRYAARGFAGGHGGLCG